MHFNKSKIFMWLAVICFIVAIIMFFSEPFSSHLAGNYGVHVTRHMVNKNKHRHPHVTYNMNKTKSASAQSIINARAHANQVAVVGQMLVPSVGLHLPIDLGVGNNSLLLGAGTMRADDTMGQGNYALAGHHMINKYALFTPLWYHAHKGTFVYITNMKKMYAYKIYFRHVISPYDINVVNNSPRPLLTLITCNDSGSRRLLLRGRLVGTASINQIPRALHKDLNRNTNNHNVLKGY